MEQLMQAQKDAHGWEHNLNILENQIKIMEMETENKIN